MDKVLLLEDEALLRTALGRALQQVGDVDIIATGSLREAVAALDAQPPNLVISDLDLPDGTGLDLLPELAVRGLRVPVIIISAHLTRFQAELPESPNIEVFAKPFDVAALVAKVRKRLIRAKSEPPPSAFAVADYLQLAGMARRSVVLSIKEADQLVGEVIVQDGEPRWARDQEGEGESAFRRLALLQRMDVSCKPLSAPLTHSNLSGSLEHLLIDAARHADECRRTPVVPPLETVRAPSADTSPQGARVTANGKSASHPAAPPPLPPRPLRSRLPPAPPRPGGPMPPIAQPTAVALPKPPNVSVTPQENTVNLSRPHPSAQQLLALDPSLKTMARADRQGSVLDAAGESDAETACAVATMAARDVMEACAELGFGRALSWQISLGASTWYVAHSQGELVIGQGAISKNPGVTLKKLAKSCGV